jgi:hypothetical protein
VYREGKAFGKRNQDLIQTYQEFIYYLRSEWQRSLTPTGKRKFGPTYFAVTWCEYEDEIGLTSTKGGVGKRWACKTCFNFAEPIWSDTDKCPSPDDALHEYVAWLGKGTNAKKPWRKRMTGEDIR